MTPPRSLRRRVLLVLAASLTLVPPHGSDAVHRSLRTQDAPTLPQSLPGATVVIASSSGSLATGQCLGVVVAPSSVVASTECLEHELRVFSQYYYSRLVVRSTHNERSEVAVLRLAHGPSVHTGGSFSLLTLKRPLPDVTPALLQPTTTSESTPTNEALRVAALESVSSTRTSLLARSACASQFAPLHTNDKWAAADWLCVDSGLTAGSRECETNATAPETQTKTKWVSDGFLFGQDARSGQDVLWGLVWSSETRCDPDAVGAPTTTPVNTVHAMRKLLATYAYGHKWTSMPLVAPMPKDTVTLTPVDAIRQTPGDNGSHSGSTGGEPVVGDSNSMRDGESRAADSEVESPTSPAPSPPTPPPRAPVPNWLGAFFDTAALLTPTTDTRRLDDTTSLALFLTPRHLVVPRLWLRGNNVSTIQWATTTTGAQFRVAKITTETEFYRDTPTALAAARDAQLDLLVVEIELPTRQDETDESIESSLPSAPIVALPPKQQATYERAVITLADRALARELARPTEPSRSTNESGSQAVGRDNDDETHVRDDDDDDQQVHVDYVDGVVRFVDASECSTGGAANAGDDDKNPEFVCANSTMSIASSTDRRAWTTAVGQDARASPTMGIFQEGGALVGFALASPLSPRASPLSPRASPTFTVLRLAAPVHKAFLEAVTNGHVVWEASDLFDDDAQQVAAYQPYTMTLYAAANDDDTANGMVMCPGLLIAPQFVLTMASCLLRAKQLENVGFTKQWENERLVAVRSDLQVPHPLYKTPDDFAVDLAVVGLVEPVLDIEPVALNPGYPAWIENATIVNAFNGVMNRETVDGGPDAAFSPPALVACGSDPHRSLQANSTSPSTCGKPSFRPRGLCVRQGTVPVPTPGRRTIRQAPAGQLLVTKTPFGALTASGFAVHVDGPKADDLGTDASASAIESTIHGNLMTAFRETTEPDVQVYLSFADNANFINGHATGVVWGASRSATSNDQPALAPPYVVGLRITHDGPNFCSGTLVASSYVLTAAHCVNDALANFVVVSGGASGPEVLAVVLETVQIHPLFGAPYQYSNDAAVLELVAPASTYGVAMDLSTDYAAKTRATMFGFGVRSSADLDKPAAVRAIDGMPLYTRAQCAATLPDIDDSMLCAGGEKGKDACQGDSGGPLIVRTAQGRDALAGIVSAGYGCGLEGVPGVYARASSLVNFVDSYAVGFKVLGAESPAMESPSSAPSRSASPRNESRSSVDPADIESYSGNSSSAGHTNSNTISTSNSNAINTSAQGAGFASALLSTLIPKDLHEPVRVAFMSFLLGDWYSFLEDPASSLNPLVDPANQFVLRSRGNADAIVTSLRRHEAKPLYKRKDRFQRGMTVKGLWEGAADASSANACNTA